MNKVFVIGAGFSKAVANAPLASDLFELIYKKVSTDNIGKRNQRAVDRDCFLSVIEYLQQQTEKLLRIISNGETKIQTSEKIPGLHRIIFNAGEGGLRWVQELTVDLKAAGRLDNNAV